MVRSWKCSDIKRNIKSEKPRNIRLLLNFTTKYFCLFFAVPDKSSRLFARGCNIGRSVREAEGDCLESNCGVKATAGSTPVFSAKFSITIQNKNNRSFWTVIFVLHRTIHGLFGISVFFTSRICGAFWRNKICRATHPPAMYAPHGINFGGGKIFALKGISYRQKVCTPQKRHE